jgi:16S rRNA (uracil1498-N3)-methyltransferase
MRRFYDNQPFQLNVAVELSENTSHHISRVLRMRPDDELIVFNGEGGEWHSKIESISKRHVQVVPLQFIDIERTPSCSVRLALPLIKGERMDYALQKATELGATSFQLLNTEHTDVRLSGERLEKRMSHWQQVVISACEQCGMNRIPDVYAPINLDAYLQLPHQGLKLIAHPGEQPLAATALQSCSEIHLLTGPEGGFSDAELSQASSNDFQPFALGQRILRAETAASALLAAIWMARGE